MSWAVLFAMLRRLSKHDTLPLGASFMMYCQNVVWRSWRPNPKLWRSRTFRECGEEAWMEESTVHWDSGTVSRRVALAADLRRTSQKQEWV